MWDFLVAAEAATSRATHELLKRRGNLRKRSRQPLHGGRGMKCRCGCRGCPTLRGRRIIPSAGKFSPFGSSPPLDARARAEPRGYIEMEFSDVGAHCSDPLCRQKGASRGGEIWRCRLSFLRSARRAVDRPPQRAVSPCRGRRRASGGFSRAMLSRAGGLLAPRTLATLRNGAGNIGREGVRSCRTRGGEGGRERPPRHVSSHTHPRHGGGWQPSHDGDQQSGGPRPAARSHLPSPPLPSSPPLAFPSRRLPPLRVRCVQEGLVPGSPQLPRPRLQGERRTR